MKMQPFSVGTSYDREDVLMFVGSRQPQSGIVYSNRQREYVAVFSGGRSARPAGYVDGWDVDGTFRYHGQGAKGDQRLLRGNKVLAGHDGIVLLFETWKPKASWKGRQRFLGEYIVSGYRWEEGQGTRAGDRILIFSFMPVSPLQGTVLPEDAGHREADIDNLRAQAIAAARTSTSSYCTSYEYRARSNAVARYVIARADGVCEACGKDAPFYRADGSPYLEVHHTRRLADDGPDDIMHVSAVCANCHREAHFGSAPDEFRRQLEKRIADREKPRAPTVQMPSMGKPGR